MQTAPQRIANDVFYRDHYRDVLALGTHLSGSLLVLGKAATLEVDVTPVVAALLDLCHRAHAVLGLGPDRAYPPSITGAMDAVSETGAMGAAIPNDVKVSDSLRRLTEHVRYFSERFEMEVAYAQGRFADASKKTLFIEAVFNSGFVILASLAKAFPFSLEDPRQATAFFDHEPIRAACPDASRAVIDACQRELDGWCGEGKTWMLYDLVRRARPKHVVEIGIFGGRSIIPIAQALRDNGAGTVTGIDAWEVAVATEEVVNFGDTFWWTSVDFAPVKQKFFEFIVGHRLTTQIRVIEAPSRVAHHCIDVVDLLHIDGNHSMIACAQDVANYFTKLKPGGILVFDDINWASTHPALEIVMRSCRLLHTVPDTNEPTAPGCAAFIKL